MTTIDKNKNPDSISWFQLMWKNGYIFAFGVILTLGILAKTDNQEPWLWWHYLLCYGTLGLALFTLVYCGFYGFWKSFNGSKGWRVWTILKGKHRSFLIRLPWFFKNYHKATFILRESCKATAGYPDINKLWGIGFGLMPVTFKAPLEPKVTKTVPAHHWTSIRIGWAFSAKENGFNLYSYVYDCGRRSIEQLCTVKADEPFTCEIYRSLADSYHIRIILSNGNVFSQNIEFRKAVEPFGYKLGFTYGGDQVAPQNMQVWQKLN